jgi:hypothetical protein
MREEWLSGLKHWFAKSKYNFFVPWVRIPFPPNKIEVSFGLYVIKISTQNWSKIVPSGWSIFVFQRKLNQRFI